MEVNKIAVLYDIHKSKVLTPLQEHHLEWIREIAPNAQVIYADSEEKLCQLTCDADILMTSRIEPAETFCQKAKRLKWVHNLYAGMDIIMKSETAKLDIKLTRTAAAHVPMSDTAIAFIFSLMRFIPALVRQQDRKIWQKYISAEESFNKTIGIIGLGTIGEEIAKKCKLLGMRVIATKRTPIKSPWVDIVYPASALNIVLKESDFVILVIPSTAETARYIGEEELRMMKNTAYFINLSRGNVVDEEALIKVLQEGVIAGAALDVFTVEPLPPESPLWELSNVIISPHMSADSPYYMDRAIQCFCENLKRYIEGKDLLNEVNREAGY